MQTPSLLVSLYLPHTQSLSPAPPIQGEERPGLAKVSIVNEIEVTDAKLVRLADGMAPFHPPVQGRLYACHVGARGHIGYNITTETDRTVP